MNWNITHRPTETVIQHGGVTLAVFQRELFLMENVRFHKQDVPLVCHWQLRYTAITCSVFEPAYDYANARIESEALDDHRAELRGEAHTKDGAVSCQFTLGITVTNDGRIEYVARQTLHVHKDYVLYGDNRGWLPPTDWQPDPARPCTFLEFTDPYFIQAAGPVTPYTRDCPEMTWPMPVFHKNHQRWWHYTTYTHANGEIIAHPNHHVVPARLLPVKRGGFVGMFWKPHGPNPVIELDSRMTRPVVTGVCDMYYDLHIGHLLPVENNRCVLPAGETLEAAYRFVSYEGPKAEDIAERMRMRPIPVADLNLLDRPAYRAGVNTFREPLYLFDESLPWGAGRGAVWDRELGHSDPFSLRVESDGSEPSQWEIGVGRDRLMNPLVEGATYRLRAWVKTKSVTGKGVRIGFGNCVAKFPGITGDSFPVEYQWSHSLKGDHDWTLLEVAGLPVPRNTTIAHLILQLDGAGQAWFDDVEFELEDPR